MRNSFLHAPVLAVVLLFAGLQQAVSQSVPPELQKKLVGKTRLNDIMKVVTDYYASEEENEEVNKLNNAEEEFENPLSFWFKWQRYMKPRLNPKGEIEQVDYYINKAFEALKTTEKQPALLGNNTARWSFVGPQTMNYYAGSYRGLGRADCIAFHPTNANIFWVGTPAAGVWKTFDGGTNWYNISFNLPTMAIASIAVSPQNPDIIYILTGDPNNGSFHALFNRNASTGVGATVWKTTDGGQNWYRCANLPTAAYSGSQVLLDPGDVNKVYVATNTGFSRSMDGGNSWLQTLNGDVTDIKLKPGDPATIYAASTIAVQVSNDFGATFGPLATGNANFGTGRKLLAVSAANPAVVYLLCGGVPADAKSSNTKFTGLFISSNSGSNFLRQDSTPNVFSLSQDGKGQDDVSGYTIAMAAKPGKATTVLVGGAITYRSTLAGVDLTNVSDYTENPDNLSRYVHPDVHNLAYNPLNNFLYNVNDGGVWLSKDDGETWTDITGNLHAATFYSLAGFAGDPNLLAGGNQDNGVKYYSQNAPFLAGFWHVVGGDGFDVAFDAANSNRWYATGNNNTYRFGGGTLEKVINPAGTGATIPDPLYDYYPVIATDPVNSNRLFVAYESGVFMSSDAGDTWYTIYSNGVKGNRGSADLVTCPSNTNRLYLTDGANIWRKDVLTNGAWTGNLALAANGFTSTGTITALAVYPGNADIIYATIGSLNDPGKKVYYSTTGGTKWSNITGTLPDIAVLSIAVDAYNNTYIGTDLGVFYQADASTDWTPYYNNLPRIPITSLVINQAAGLIRAATYGHGVWEAPLFSTCDANMTIDASQAGNQFYEVSNQLISGAEITGGSGTSVMFKAGNEVVMDDNFVVYEGNQFRAFNGPCEGAPTPQFKTTTTGKTQLPWVAGYTLPSGTQNNFPYGSLSIESISGNQLQVKITATQNASYSLVVSEWKDATSLASDIFTSAAEGTINRTLTLPDLPASNYLVLLYCNGKLVHYQQLQVR